MRKRGIEEFKYKAFQPRTDGISGTLTSVLKDNLVLEPATCAMRGRDHGKGKWEQTLEIGGDIANTITHAAKDSMVMIPQEIQQAADRIKAIAQNGRQSEIGVTIHPNYNLRPYRADRADKPTASEFDTKYEKI